MKTNTLNRPPAIEQLPEMSANALELEARQHQALQVVRQISRFAGRELPLQAVAPGEGLELSRPGIYILDHEVAARGAVKGTSFTIDKKKLSGAADSAHAVLVGGLETKYASGHVSQTQIAAKCYLKRTFAERLTRAQREVNITREMAMLGELALNPVAVAVTPESFEDGAVVLLTRFEKDLFTLDNMPWNRGLNPINLANANMASRVLGRFNQHGWTHHDAKIKNIASQAGGKVGMIDFETSKPFDVSDPIQASDAAYVDFGSLTASLADKGLFRLQGIPGTALDNAPKIRDTLYGMAASYADSWQDAPGEVGARVLDAAIDVADTRLAEIELARPSAYV